MPHAKFRADLLKTVAVHKEQRNTHTLIIIIIIIVIIFTIIAIPAQSVVISLRGKSHKNIHAMLKIITFYALLNFTTKLFS